MYRKEINPSDKDRYGVELEPVEYVIYQFPKDKLFTPHEIDFNIAIRKQLIAQLKNEIAILKKAQAISWSKYMREAEKEREESSSFKNFIKKFIK